MRFREIPNAYSHISHFMQQMLSQDMGVLQTLNKKKKKKKRLQALDI